MTRIAISTLLIGVASAACISGDVTPETIPADEPVDSPAVAATVPDWLKSRELRPTYAGGIALIYEHRCVGCHRPGEVAPMSFTSYGEIRQWATGATNTPLESLIETRAMPPWPADPAVGEFSNSGFLTKLETDLLLQWVRNGFPRGEGTFSAKRRVEGWNIGEPDLVFELPKHTLAQDSQGETKEFLVESNLPEDRWIVAAEARPGDAGVVLAIDAGPLGCYRPGNSFVEHAAGTGRLLRAGAKIPVRVHYRKPKGRAATDQSRLGLVFARDPSTPRRNIAEDPMAAADFTIPAGAANFEVAVRFEFPADGQIISLMPVMNLRGKDVSYTAILPDGTRKPLLSIPQWDPMWQYRYQLRSPLHAPKGTVVEAIAHFDNSQANIRNPDPHADVRSGAGEEVFEGWLGYWQRLPR
jgi:hypothetical protein